MLELNGRKTSIEPTVDPLDAQWKSLSDHLDGGMTLNSPKRLVSFFDGAFKLAKEHCDDSVLKYMSKVSWKAIEAHPTLWRLYVPLLLHTITVDSRAVDTVAAILTYMKYSGTLHEESLIFSVFSAFIRRHASLQNGFEVSWGLWCLRALDLMPRFQLPTESVSAVVAMNDDMAVTQLALYATQGLISVPSLGEWEGRATVGYGCSNEHWLFAYEAKLRGWCKARIDKTEPKLLAMSLADGISFIDENSLGNNAAAPAPTQWASVLLMRPHSSVISDTDGASDSLMLGYE